MQWQPISTLDKSKYQFVLVTSDADTIVRLHLWNPRQKVWERPYPIGSVVSDVAVNDCPNPTHWMPCPLSPGHASSGLITCIGL